MLGVKARTIALMIGAASVTVYGYQASSAQRPAQVKKAANGQTAGKPKPAAKVATKGTKAATPLTPEQQELYETGSQIYKNICTACHQPDGRGKEKIAPSLVDSAFAVGPADIPIRILLNGKQGDVGLMPPLAGTLSNEQIAGVVTYIRREWGHKASAVDPGTVARVRSQVSDRTKPWTNDELQALKSR